MAYTYPLGMAVEGSDELLIRDPVVANEKGEITLAAKIPEGSFIRLMIGDRDRAIGAAKWAAERAKEQLDGATPAFAGICMYADWTTDDMEWAVYDKVWKKMVE